MWKPLRAEDDPEAKEAVGKQPDPLVPVAPEWPEPETVQVDGQEAAQGLDVGGLPIEVSTAEGAEVESPQVEVVDRETAEELGVDGVVVAVTTPQKDAELEVSLGYEDFAEAGGAGFGERLRMVSLPACALTTPELPECQVQSPVPSSNDPVTQTVTGELDLQNAKPVESEGASEDAASPSAEPEGASEDAVKPSVAPMVLSVVALAAGPSGSSGSFEASSLAPSSKWGVSGGTGAFTWSYPLITPPAGNQSEVGPDIALSYNSAAVDGRIASSNNQPGWIGQGWSYEPGYIERSYVTCADDPEGKAPKRQDLCWQGEVLNLSLGANSSTLIKDDATGTWHPQEDNGTKVERLTSTTNGNGARDGEYWRVTMPDGMVYEFGRNYGPGRTDQVATNSTWTVPVYGAQSGDPCYSSSGFASSRCVQGWRWNLDYVEDVNGNAAMYYYEKETNYYNANQGTALVSYTRGGYLKRIEYGLTKVDNSVYGSGATAKVEFTTEERCIKTGSFDCATGSFTAANAQHWPDTPQDQACASSGTCNNWAPTFWSRKRLTKIEMFAGPSGSLKKLDGYALDQSYPDNGDKALWLKSITHTGYTESGTAVAEPPVTFNGTLMDNRVDGHLSMAPMLMWRIASIISENGKVTQVTYSSKDCTSSSLPDTNALQSNTKRCFPVKWTPVGHTTPVVDFFHKYVVNSVRELDPAGVSPTQLTTYTYVGHPAWHFDDNELTKASNRTYGQFRGYQQVETRTGDPAVNTVNGADAQTLTKTSYFRGMHGDKLPSGTRTVSVTNSLDESATDYEYLNGQVYEEQTFNGTAVLTKTLTEFTKVATTATHARKALPDIHAVITAPSRTRTISSIAAGGSHTVTVATKYDSLGRATAVTETADGKPAVCTTTSYAVNTGRNILLLPAQQNRYAGSCPASGTPTGELLDSQRYFYDGSNTLGQVPGVGNMTKGQSAVKMNGSTVEYATTVNAYDSVGRVTSATEYTSASDTTGRKYTTTFSPASGPVTSMKTTNPLGQSQTQYFDLRGRLTKVVSVAGLVSEAQYDALGRVVAVWEPGYPRTGPATTKYTYTVTANGVDSITTQEAVSSGSSITYATSIQLFDKFSQLVQVQADAANGGRVIDDMTYDSHGWVVKTNNHWYALGAPQSSLVTTADSGIDSRTVTKYDKAGRPTEVISYKGLTETRRSKTIYGGDRITQIPPAGGTTTQAVFDSLGNTVELKLYTSAPTINENVVTGGTATTTKYEHDHDGQMIKLTDPKNAVWTNTYDMAGRLVASTDPDAGSSSFVYNHTGELLSSVDARGVPGTVNYSYDALGRKTQVKTKSGTTDVVQGEWVYDTVKPGLPSSTRTYLRGNSANVLEEKVLGYNEFGLPTKTQTVVPQSEAQLAGTYTTDLTYTPTGGVKTVQLPAAGGLPAETLTYGYNEKGLPSALTGANKYVTKTVYDPFGQTSQVTGREGDTLVWSTTRDPETLAVTSSTLSAASAQPQVSKHAYTYDKVGKITRIDTGLYYGTNGQPTVRTMCYKFDPLQRITDAWAANDKCATTPTPAANSQVAGVVPTWQSWTFDEVGNRLTAAVNKLSGPSTLPASSTKYNYGTTGHKNALTSDVVTANGVGKTTSYTYDAAGNTLTRVANGVTRNYTWNADGSLSKITQGSQTSSFVYTADGSQVLRADAKGTTLFLPGMDLVKTGTTVKGTRYYQYDGQTIAQRGPDGLRAMFADQVGSSHTTVLWSNLSSVTRRFSDPYGNELGVMSGPWPNGRSFLDKPIDTTTGLIDMGARKYDPQLGRFISVDPVLDPSNPLSLNGYSYTNGDPVNDADPTGEWSWGSAWRAAKNFAGGAANYFVRSAVETVQFGATAVMWASGRKSWSQASQASSRWGNRAMSKYRKVEDRLGINRNSRAYKNGYTAAKIADTVTSVIAPAKGAARLAMKLGVKGTAKLGVKQAGRQAVSQASSTGARQVRNATAVSRKSTTSVGRAVSNSAPATKRAAGVGGAKSSPVVADRRFRAAGPTGSSGGGKATEFYRGAKQGQEPSFQPSPRDYKVNKSTGRVEPTHGVSVFDNPESVSNRGFVPHRVDQDSVPPELRIIQRGVDPHHFEIVPVPGVNLTPEEFASCLVQIKCG
ncbi:hypothetical protein P0D62_07925 [Tessaracoccus sp. HF-7]|nr:hypothetical protein [Tessaracoccus caeni]